jgi:hypothetical protein
MKIAGFIENVESYNSDIFRNYEQDESEKISGGRAPTIRRPSALRVRWNAGSSASCGGHGQDQPIF